MRMLSVCAHGFILAPIAVVLIYNLAATLPGGTLCGLPARARFGSWARPLRPLRCFGVRVGAATAFRFFGI